MANKYSIELPTALVNRITDIPCLFTNSKGVNNHVVNAFLTALTKKAVTGKKNTDFGKLGKESFRTVLDFEEEHGDSRFETFRLPEWLFEMVKKKYAGRCKVCQKLDEQCNNCSKKLRNKDVFCYAISDGLLHPPNLDSVPPAYHFVGQKNDKMQDKTNNILTDILNQDNILYVEPFCGSAALFLSLPFQLEPDSKANWKYILSDLSKNKVNLLRAIKYHPLELMAALAERKYNPDKYSGKNNETRQRLTAKVEWFGEYFTYDWFFDQAASLRNEKNEFKQDYLEKEIVNGEESDVVKKVDVKINYLEKETVDGETLVVKKTKIETRERSKPTPQITKSDNPRDKSCHVEFAADFLIYATITFRRKLSVKKFTEYIEQIPLISTKLNQAKAKILWGDGIEIVKKYGTTSELKEYTGYRPLLVIDPPYIGTEEQCGDKEFPHDKLATAIHKSSKHSLFLYFCRSSSPLRIKEDRDIADRHLKREIDSYFRGHGYYFEEYPLWDRTDMPIDEFMITNFEHGKSTPYTRIPVEKPES
jgi:hypothetical protein